MAKLEENTKTKHTIFSIQMLNIIIDEIRHRNRQFHSMYAQSIKDSRILITLLYIPYK